MNERMNGRLTTGELLVTKRLAVTVVAATIAAALTGCSLPFSSQEQDVQNEAPVASESADSSDAATTNEAASTKASGATGFTTADLFTERDLTQEPDVSNAQQIQLKSGEDVSITEEGIYVLVGTGENVTVTIDADAAKVQLVLDGVSITNADAPAIYVKNADKVFVTTAQDSDNTLTVTDTFVADGDTNTDAVIFAKSDVILNGLGTLHISSTENGVTSKDDLKITGGSYEITTAADALEAHDSIRIADGTLSITSSKDGLHAENDEDDTVGYIYIGGGTFDIDAAGDAIQGTTYVQIDGGTFNLNAAEAIEGTYVQVNDGDITIDASDDGINASAKSASLTPTIEICGGNLTITMAQGDTDALDSNGYLYVRGGTININAQFAFDFETGAEMTGGTVYVNGEQVSEITESMGGGPMGGMGGPMGGPAGENGEMGGPAGDPMGEDGEHGGPRAPMGGASSNSTAQVSTNSVA